MVATFLPFSFLFHSVNQCYLCCFYKDFFDYPILHLTIIVHRRIPEGTGWVLDSYPQNYNQAKMLEKALSGYDANAPVVTKKEPKKPRKSSLVPDPRPPPPPPEPPSGIDVVILFDIRDELCLKRATGRYGKFI